MEHIDKLLNGHYKLILSQLYIVHRQRHRFFTAHPVPLVPHIRLYTDKNVTVLLVITRNQVRSAVRYQPKVTNLLTALRPTNVNVILLVRRTKPL